MHCDYIYILLEKIKCHICHDWKYDSGQSFLLMLNLTVSEHSGKKTHQQDKKFFNVTDNIISTLPKSYIWLQPRENISEWDTNHRVQRCNGWESPFLTQWVISGNPKALDWRESKHSTTEQMVFFNPLPSKVTQPWGMFEQLPLCQQNKRLH